MIYDLTEYSATGNGTAKSWTTNNKTFDNTVNWSFEAEIKITGSACRIDIVPPTYERTLHLGIGANTQGYLTSYVGKLGGGEQNDIKSTLFQVDEYIPIKITKEGTTIKFYYDGTLIRTDTRWADEWIEDYSQERVLFTTWSTNTIYIKNMKVEGI